MTQASSMLIRQGWIAFIAMCLPILGSFFAPDYDWVGQHMSALGRGDHWSGLGMEIGAVLAGLSILAFAAGCLILSGALRWSFTALTALAFGAAMVANGIFPMGTPMHGLYGLAIFSVLVPAFFIAEFGSLYPQRWMPPYCLAVSFLGLGYMWFLLVGLDPEGYAGLTQRVFTVLSFSWFGIVALLKLRDTRHMSQHIQPTAHSSGAGSADLRA